MKNPNPLLDVEPFSDLPPVPGVRLFTAETGMRYTNRPDLLLAIVDQGTRVAGVFTTSSCRAAPVDWCRERLAAKTARALIVNAGNANALTGKQGYETVVLTAEIAAQAANCKPEEVFVASTGIIGEPVDAHSFRCILDAVNQTSSSASWMEAAQAITTTDTRIKLATRTIEIAGTPVVINGIAKGAGMIAPNMATTLCFVFTNASIDAETLQAMLTRCVDISFNAITVDGDTSTNDTLLLFATGKSGSTEEVGKKELEVFEFALLEVLQSLALQVVNDGEGAQKLFEVNVRGAQNDEAARTIAFSIANSPLVKTALTGQDANWGRVIMAIGKSGEHVHRDSIEVWFGAHRLAYNGERDPACQETQLADYMKNREITITVDLHIGSGKAKIWSCDLTQDYVSLNATLYS